MKYIFILTLLLLTSCSTRKVSHSLSNSESSSYVSDTTKLEQKTTQIDKFSDTTKIIEIELTPIDASKEIIINGYSIKNASIKLKTIKKGISTTKEKNNVLKEIKGKSEIIIKTDKISTKETERTSPSIILSVIIGVVGVGLIAYELKRKL